MTKTMRTALLGGAGVVLVAAAATMLWPAPSGSVVPGPGKWAREIAICREVIFDAELYAREPLNFLEDTVWHQEVGPERVNFGVVVIMRNPQGTMARHNYECDTYLGDLVNSFVRPQNSAGTTNRNLR